MRSCTGIAARDDFTKVVSRVKDEAKGQSLDLAEMGDAARSALKGVQEAQKRHTTVDAKVQGKLKTLSASLKAYNNRLNNVQNEAKALQADAEATMKLLWGNENVSEGGSASVEAETVEAERVDPSVEADFDVEVPPVAKKFDDAMKNAKPVESVEAEKVSGGGSSKSGETQPEELEIEIEVDEPSPADDVPVTQITQELYEKGIDFADCTDAKSLRKRYADVLAGKYDAPAPPQQAQRQTPPQSHSRPPQQQQQTHQGGYGGNQAGGYQGYGGSGYNSQSQTTETGLAFDPHPGAQRKMIDPNKPVWEVKNEVARENGVDPNTVDLWAGTVLLADHKRLYEYGSLVQTNPIEVRSKGDAPRSPPQN